MTLNPEQVAEDFRKHFSETSSEEFKQRLGQYNKALPEENRMEEIEKTQEDEGGQLVLFRPQTTPSPLPLDAYLACALTGLTEDQRQMVFHVSDIVATVCESLGINLYEPRKKTDPVHNAEVEDTEVFRIDRERVLNSDLLVHLCYYPSTGAGEELAFAYDALVPIILIFHDNTRVSRMITGIPGFKLKISYTEPEDMRRELRDCLIKVRPILEERKMAFSSYNSNIVGNRIRSLREGQGLTREDVANKIQYLTIDTLRLIEESMDKTSNLSLLQLREIATVLNTTVAELVEPNLHGLVMSSIEDWLEQKTAARYGNIEPKDKKRLLRRILRQWIDHLDTE